MSRTATALLIPTLVSALLGGCQTLVPFRTDPQSAELPLADTWTTAVAGQAIASGWIQSLGDPRLSFLVAEAVAKNYDLRAAAARVRAAQAQAALTATGERPAVDLAAGATRRGSATASGIRSTGNSFNTQFDVAWETDVWGRLADATNAAELDARAITADHAAARLSLAASVAQAWFNTLEAERQLALAKETARNFGDNLGIVEDGFRSGLNSALDVRLERANLAGAQARQAARTIDRDRALRGLELLLGRYPGAELATEQKLPHLTSSVPAGLPADLLRRRPDVRGAALRLQAADRRVDEARKERLPSIRLTGAGGVSSGELRHLLDFDSLLWNIATSIAAPIFDAGRIDAQVTLQKARADEALSNYAQTVLTAFLEVETALAAEAHLATQESALRTAADESERAATLALERYRKGLVDIITWLEARRRAFDARSSLINISNQRLQNRIALHLALAGDFTDANEGGAETRSGDAPREINK